ncbi:Conserved_hypothetical protein [Hexamita inflata]|uniref:Uncharacterized protein n=1 Tax=Hexamita inflata TaxID=28002 RepID=A0AA86UY63_9EUKA|nr:Conserved hypothetical protein [Hexamita inflata]
MIYHLNINIQIIYLSYDCQRHYSLVQTLTKQETTQAQQHATPLLNQKQLSTKRFPKQTPLARSRYLRYHRQTRRGLVAHYQSLLDLCIIRSDVRINIKRARFITFSTSIWLLFGRSTNQNNSLQIQQTCLSLAFKSYTTFNYFGVIGFFEGLLQFQTSNVIINAMSQDTFDRFGTLGASTSLSYSSSSSVSVIVNGNGGQHISALVGNNLSPNTTVMNCSVYSTFIQGGQFVGGYFGNSQQVSIKYSKITESVVKGSYSAGLIGYAFANVIQIANCTVQNVTVGTNNYCGGLIGQLQAGSIMMFSNNVVTMSTVSCVSHAGGFIGFADESSNIVISEGILSSNNITASNANAGGFIGTFSTVYSGCTLKIVTSRISSVRVFSPNSAGIAVGYRYPAFTVSTSILRGENYVNNIKIANCANYATTC